MSQIDRLVVSRGPALVTYKTGSFFSKEDIVVDLSKETKEIPSDAFGPLTEIITGRKASTKFKPVGEFEHLDVLWTPFATMLPGTSLFGSSDTPLLIQPLDSTQKQVRFYAAAITKPPGLTFTTQDTLIEDVEFEMIGKNNTDVADPAFPFAFETNTIPGTLPYDPNNLLIQAYGARWMSAGTVVWTYGANSTSALAYNISSGSLSTALNALASIISAGGVTVSGNVDTGWTITFSTNGARTNFTGTLASLPGGTSFRQDILVTGDGSHAQKVLIRLYPWNAFNSREGIKVTFDVQNSEDKSDAIGHYDTIFRSLSVKAALIPQGVADSDAMAAAAVQGANAVVGSKLITGAHDFIIQGSGVWFQLYSANIRKAGLVYSSDKQRIPEFEWVASRSIGGGGALNPLFYIGTAAP